MPPRSYYNSPRQDDYTALLSAFQSNQETTDNAMRFFEKYQIPYISGLNELAHYLCVETSTLYNILRKKEKNYREFEIKQANGKIRQITSPRTYMKVIQWWVLDNILLQHQTLNCVHGFVKSKSYYTNAKFHFGAHHILSVDVKDFFPSIKTRQVYNIFAQMGYSSRAADLLTEFCTLKGKLPQGAPSSPTISNIVFEKVDIELEEFSQKYGLKYSRYADDLCFSSQEPISKNVLRLLKPILGSAGFSLNRNKTRFSGLGDRMEVTGLVINDKIQLPRKWRNNARALFFQASQSPIEYCDRLSELYGILNTLKHFNQSNEKTKLIILGENAVREVSSISA